MSHVVPVGIAAPNALTGTVERADSGLNLTTVTGVSLNVRRPDGTVATWTASIVGSATAALLTWAHTFDAADCAEQGSYKIVALLTTASGVIPCAARTLSVVDRFSI